MNGTTPLEESALFNPAFLALILHEAAKEYEGQTGGPLLLALAYLVPAVVLVSSIRVELPKTKATSFATWVQRNPRIRLRFADVACSTVELVQEGLVFGASSGLVDVDIAGITALGHRPRSGGVLRENTEEFRDIVRRARFVGGWYASAGSVETIYAIWGVRP